MPPVNKRDYKFTSPGWRDAVVIFLLAIIWASALFLGVRFYFHYHITHLGASMINFQPDQVTFKDTPGYGTWDDNHAREHMAFVQSFATKTAPVLIPDYNMLQFLNAGSAQKSQIEVHMRVHDILRPLVGITGVDLASFNLQEEGDFYDFLGVHAKEHAQIRAFLGMT